jgi:hypothetical protein
MHHLSNKVQSTSDKSEAASLLVNDFIDFVAIGQEEEAKKEPRDLHTSMSLEKYMKQFCEKTIIPTNKTVSTLWPGAKRNDLINFNDLITRCKNFSQGFKVSDDNITLGVDKSDQNLRLMRQSMLRELGVLEATMRIVNKLKPITEMYDTAQNSKNKKKGLLDAEQQIVKFGGMLLSAVLDVVYYCILDNTENQMYVADYLPDLLAHLSSQPLAGKCVTAMLSTNMELQETKITRREISIFIDKLRGSKMNSMYLNLLQSCCSCEGNGVDGNQCKVAEMLFEDTNDVIITMIVDFNKVSPYDWGESIYIPDGVVVGSPVEGQTLVDKGLPELALAWTTNAIELSPLGLFGKLSVRVADLYRVEKKVPKVPVIGDMSPTKSSGVKKGNKKSEEASNQKKSIADYFINEMYLGAEMCMDRNYIAMYKLDPLFSFEALVTMMAMDVNPKVKAAACRLLFCLHVDRDPQVGTKIPCLTRTWSDIMKSEVPPLPYVEPARRNVYSLIQHLCSEHIRSMEGKRWEEYSKFILEMHKGLITFNFYGTVERLKDVITPTIRAIDRRMVDYGKNKNKIKNTSDGAAAIGESADANDESGLFDDSEVKEEVEDRTKSWQASQFKFLESLPFMICILLLVLAAVAVTLWQVIVDAPETLALAIFGYVVLSIFLYDYFMRLYCYAFVHGEVKGFVLGPYNIIDAVVILIDVIFLVMPADLGGSSANFSKTLRLIRLVRLVRVLRAAKVINFIRKKKEDVVKWNAPERYLKIPLFELETMTEAINILLFVQGVIDDRNLSIMLRYFYLWEAGYDSRSPKELFLQAVDDAQELSLAVSGFDDIFIDNIMYKHLELTKGALEVIQARHSMRNTLMNNIKEVQLLVSPKRERQFKLISAIVQQLERNAETHELWGELQSDVDHATNKQTKEILHELIDICRVRCAKLEFGLDYVADAQIQDLLRNLGLFDISLKVLGLMDSVEEDEEGELDAVALNTRELCLLCNELLYWFTLGNPANQKIVYSELETFLGMLDDEIKAHKVVRAIFKDNEDLMKMVPHSLLDEMADQIVTVGKSHHYLALASSITHVGEKNITKNQFAVVKSLCSPAKLDAIALWLCSPKDPAYQDKLEIMEAAKDVKSDDLDNLPGELAYHINFLEILSNCTVGRINITSVEAKVQSVFLVVDIVESILHPDTILIVKKFLTLHLFNAIIEVEIMIPGLEVSKCVWDLLFSYRNELKHLTKDCRVMDESKWQWEDLEGNVTRQTIEYYLSCIMVIQGFFARYYDVNALGQDNAAGGDSSRDITSIDADDANALIQDLADILMEFHNYNSPFLPEVYKTFVYEALESLNKSSSKPMYHELDKHTENDEEEVDEEDMNPDLLHEKLIHDKFDEFLAAIEEDEEIQNEINDENKLFIECIETMPYLADGGDSEIRFEPFIQKLVAHIRDNMSTVDGERRLKVDCISSVIFIIKAFRTMIENKMGMSIYERDDDGGDEEDERAAPTVTALNGNGVVGVCLDLIAIGIPEDLQHEVVKLLVGMLFKEGGAREVQGSVNDYLVENDSELFFKQCRHTIQALIAWHKWNDVIEVEEGADPEPHESILIIRMLQLLCEGHFLPNQDIVRAQPNNHTSINLLDDFVMYFNALSRIRCRTSTAAAKAVGDVIVEIIQGPCVGNQEHFTLNTELLEIQNRIMRSKVVVDCVEEEEIEVKKICLDTISALLEGRKAGETVTERILSVIHLDIILQLSKPPVFEDEDTEPPSEDAESLQTDCGVLLQMLCDYKPSIRADLDAEGGFTLDADATASVEISWDGVLNRRFFPVPDVCRLLAKSSKDRLVVEVDRSNPENKLIDFLTRSEDLYREVKHQQYLEELGIASVFSRTMQDRATWLTFLIACTCNGLMIAYYHAKYGAEANMPDRIDLVVAVLNYIQIFVASFTAILTVVVRSPVIAAGLADTGLYTQFEVWTYTALDPMTMYYFAYLIISICGTVLADYYLALLLLDIVVKDVTTADVLNAVIEPRKQLGYALLLGLFVAYIFSFYTFWYYADQVDHGDVAPFCETLYDCTKFCISYGLQNGGGIADNMFHHKEERLILDLMWFIVVLVVFINIIFGIVIDTFSSLRALKMAKQENTVNTCFICSIGRQTFDRADDQPDGYKRHIRNDHNMWAYLSFIFFLWEQDKDDDDGLEYYVRHKLYSREITWFPLHKAMCLNQEISGTEKTTHELSTSVTDSHGNIAKNVTNVQSDIDHLLHGLTETLCDKNYSGGGDLFMGGDEKGRYDGLEDEEEWNPTWGYNVSTTIREIRSIDIPDEELTNINFRLISDMGLYNGKSSSSEGSTKSSFFDHGDPLRIADGYVEGDLRAIQFQILQDTGAGISKFIAVIEVQLSELMAGEDGAEFLKSFNPPGQAEPSFLVLGCHYEKATTYAAGGDEDDAESEEN